jgi:hypothetical protein
MSRSDKSLDEQIAEVEGRIARRRAELRLLAAEARSRISVTKSIPVAMALALGVGFAASRFVRRPARRAPAPVDRRSHPARLLGAIAGVMLPPLIRPLQHLVAEWLAERVHRGAR